MTKREKFKPVKVGNRGYMPGRRQRMFSFPPQSAKLKKTPASAANADEGKQTQHS